MNIIQQLDAKFKVENHPLSSQKNQESPNPEPHLRFGSGSVQCCYLYPVWLFPPPPAASGGAPSSKQKGGERGPGEDELEWEWRGDRGGAGEREREHERRRNRRQGWGGAGEGKDMDKGAEAEEDAEAEEEGEDTGCGIHRYLGSANASRWIECIHVNKPQSPLFILIFGMHVHTPPRRSRYTGASSVLPTPPTRRLLPFAPPSPPRPPVFPPRPLVAFSPPPQPLRLCLAPRLAALLAHLAVVSLALAQQPLTLDMAPRGPCCGVQWLLRPAALTGIVIEYLRAETPTDSTSHETNFKDPPPATTKCYLETPSLCRVVLGDNSLPTRGERADFHPAAQFTELMVSLFTYSGHLHSSMGLASISIQIRGVWHAETTYKILCSVTAMFDVFGFRREDKDDGKRALRQPGPVSSATQAPGTSSKRQETIKIGAAPKETRDWGRFREGRHCLLVNCPLHIEPLFLLTVLDTASKTLVNFTSIYKTSCRTRTFLHSAIQWDFPIAWFIKSHTKRPLTATYRHHSFPYARLQRQIPTSNSRYFEIDNLYPTRQTQTAPMFEGNHANTGPSSILMDGVSAPFHRIGDEEGKYLCKLMNREGILAEVWDGLVKTCTKLHSKFATSVASKY
ncbi:hypothetical protein DFH08DRAFT_1041440 [Mycena albidolilacea]|uniref:Uncharacterized protein n=1 Tax=Mycena albidolilacea TaxID=1033008 RepID=A0AAD7ED37_9AGAR|nr:hypothetical protein DFH08DRAFT_1041440 [Mycena albidolilacea]